MLNKEEVKIGDILVSNRRGFAKVIGEGTDSFGVLINGEKDSIMFKQLKHWKKFENPIKDNRLVSSYTFAVRFKHFLDWIPQNWVHSQPHYLEEFEYMQYVAEALLTHQLKTVTDENEIKYFKNLNLL